MRFKPTRDRGRGRAVAISKTKNIGRGRRDGRIFHNIDDKTANAFVARCVGEFERIDRQTDRENRATRQPEQLRERAAGAIIDHRRRGKSLFRVAFSDHFARWAGEFRCDFIFHRDGGLAGLHVAAAVGCRDRDGLAADLAAIKNRWRQRPRGDAAICIERAVVDIARGERGDAVRVEQEGEIFQSKFGRRVVRRGDGRAGLGRAALRVGDDDDIIADRKAVEGLGRGIVRPCILVRLRAAADGSGFGGVEFNQHVFANVRSQRRA